MRGWALLALVSLPALAAPALSPPEAAQLLQRMADASRRLSYEGVFISQHGDRMQTLSVANRPAGADKESRLMALDGVQREVRCSQAGAHNVVAEAGQMRLEKRLSTRHFPDLLPVNAAPLANWYVVKPGEMTRVAGLDCRQVELIPKDAYRWGYILCIEKDTHLPLRAVMVNEQGQPLMQFAFAEVKLGIAPSLPAVPLTVMSEAARPVVADSISVKSLPPGFTRIAAVRRHVPNHPGEVEHWVYSDGLTHISLFLESAHHPVEALKGQSKRGMINLLTRQVGHYQVTVLGDAPWAAVELVATHLEARR